MHEELDLAKEHVEKLLSSHADKSGSDSDNSLGDIIEDIPPKVVAQKSRMSMEYNFK